MPERNAAAASDRQRRLKHRGSEGLAQQDLPQLELAPKALEAPDEEAEEDEGDATS